MCMCMYMYVSCVCVCVCKLNLQLWHCRELSLSSGQCWIVGCVWLEQLQSEVEKPFLTFRENFKKDMKRFDHHIADLRKQLVGRYAAVEKVHTNTAALM